MYINIRDIRKNKDIILDNVKNVIEILGRHNLNKNFKIKEISFNSAYEIEYFMFNIDFKYVTENVLDAIILKEPAFIHKLKEPTEKQILMVLEREAKPEIIINFKGVTEKVWIEAIKRGCLFDLVYQNNFLDTFEIRKELIQRELKKPIEEEKVNEYYEEYFLNYYKDEITKKELLKNYIFTNLKKETMINVMEKYIKDDFVIQTLSIMEKEELQKIFSDKIKRFIN